MLPSRYLVFVLCCLSFLLCLCGMAGLLGHRDAWHGPLAWIATALTGLLTLLGTVDLLQQRQSIRRNYPILAHFRFMIEGIRPEIRQYLLESDEEELPFSRAQRALVYQRAKNTLDKRPFGTLQSVYQDDYEWINHSIAPTTIESHDLRILIGPQCSKPYSASIFNISAMSFGALSANAVRALNAGARLGNFFHDTGEGSISRYHREHGGDLVWEIGSGYFGCRDAEGRFDPARFADNAASEQVRMIELKLSQGAKPGQGGILPGAKVSAEIAEARGVPIGQDCLSPPRHSAFDSPIGLLEFIARLRELSAGKPTGFKLALGHPWEWFALVKAMLETRILPDFIVVDGGEGGTGAAPVEFTDHVGMPLREALSLVHNTLIGAGLRDKLRIGASGKIVSAFDVARVSALGADFANSARGFMFAVGCIQAQSCHTGTCPTGVTTQDPVRQRALVVPDKAQRVFHFHQNTLKAVKELLAAAGLSHTDQLGPEHILKRLGPADVRPLSALYPSLHPGQLLREVPEHPVYKRFWAQARADSFAPPLRVSSLWDSKSQ